jgi:hypothetical protein
MKRSHLTLFVLACFAAVGRAHSPADSLGVLSVSSDPAGADVYLDSLYVGKTPIREYALPEGSYRLKIYYPSVFAWDAVSREDTVGISAQRRSEKVVELGTVLRVQSVPEGGSVTYRGNDLGVTPLFLTSPVQLRGEIVVQKEGFVPQRLAIDGNENVSLAVRLQPEQGRPGLLPSDVLAESRAIGPSHWLAYASGTTMIVSGVVSAYLKDQANRKFDQFLVTRDPALLASTRTLDREAAASLILTQISFALLSYLLLSE